MGKYLCHHIFEGKGIQGIGFPIQIYAGEVLAMHLLARYGIIDAGSFFDMNYTCQRRRPLAGICAFRDKLILRF